MGGGGGGVGKEGGGVGRYSKQIYVIIRLC